MALLKIGSYLINSTMISLIELYATACCENASLGTEGSDRVTIYLPRVGRGGVAAIGGCIHFDDEEEVQAIRSYYNNPDNSEITFITKPTPLRVKEEDYEFDGPCF